MEQSRESVMSASGYTTGQLVSQLVIQLVDIVNNWSRHGQVSNICRLDKREMGKYRIYVGNVGLMREVWRNI